MAISSADVVPPREGGEQDGAEVGGDGMEDALVKHELDGAHEGWAKRLLVRFVVDGVAVLSPELLERDDLLPLLRWGAVLDEEIASVSVPLTCVELVFDGLKQWTAKRLKSIIARIDRSRGFVLQVALEFDKAFNFSSIV